MYLICLFLENKQIKHMNLKTLITIICTGKSCFMLFECTKVVILCKIIPPHDFFKLKESKKYALINVKQWYIVPLITYHCGRDFQWQNEFLKPTAHVAFGKQSKIGHISSDLRLDDLALVY